MEVKVSFLSTALQSQHLRWEKFGGGEEKYLASASPGATGLHCYKLMACNVF